MKKEKIFIGVAWPYVNGNLHIGHLGGYLVPADVFARYNRQIGNDVLMVSGSDCHGTPITVEADKRQLPPKDIVEEYHSKDSDLFLNKLKLSYDIYTRTDNPTHKRIVQEMFLILLNKGYIYIGESDQYYSEIDKKFLPDRYVIGECPNCGLKNSRSDQCDRCGKILQVGELIDPKSVISNNNVELRKSSHYFLNWPKLQEELQEFVDKSEGWRSWVKSETLGWLKNGLQSRAITRDIDWGVELPINQIPEQLRLPNPENKRFYVWFDAVIGYLSASILWAESNNRSWEGYWKIKYSPKHYYFMGKDNLVFHTLFWPGKLMVYDKELKLPDVPAVNMYLNYNGEKFSKSRGNSIDIDEFVYTYSNDVVRFYMVLTMPETKDSNFTFQDFFEKTNGILVDKISNFIYRVLKIGQNSFEFDTDLLLDPELFEYISQKISSAHSSIKQCRFKDYLQNIIDLADLGNQRITEKEIWKLKNHDKNIFKKEMFNMYAMVLAAVNLLYPITPDTVEKVLQSVGINSPVSGKESDISDILEQIYKIDVSKEPIMPFRKIEHKQAIS